MKPLGEFALQKDCTNGISGVCKQCTRERATKWYLANKDRRFAQATANRLARKAKVVASFGDRCADCQITYPQYVYQFHHLDPSQKDVNPSKAISWSEKRMWKELNKCVMLCANCHMIRHHGKEAIE